jgi:hypothetical protein
MEDLDAYARALIDDNLSVTLGTSRSKDPCHH